MKPIQACCFSLLAVLSALLVAPAALATAYYYDNDSSNPGFGAAGGAWAAPTPGPVPGWSIDGTGSSVPGSVTTGTGDALNFGSSLAGLAAGTITVSSGMNAGSLTYGSLSGPVTLSGGSINLGTTTAATLITQGSTNAQTINSAIALGNTTQTISLSGGNLALGGVVTSGGTASALKVGGTKSLTLSGGSLALGTSSGALSVGEQAASDAVTLNIAENVTALTLNLGGGIAGASGAIYQTGGTVAFSSNASDSCLSLGGPKQSSGGYGYYNISGGTLNAYSMDIGARADSTGQSTIGILDVMGGIANSQNSKIEMARDNGGNGCYGILNISGGTVNWGTAATTTIEFGTQHATDYGQITVGGGANPAALVGPNNSAGGINFGAGINAATSILNLLPNGTVTTPQLFISGANTSVYSLLNFNGGTLKATPGGVNSAFITGLKAATVYSGNGTIDNNGQAVSIGQALLAPTAGSYGVTATTITPASGGSGYIGAPLVQITGGTANNGKVATAVAIMSGGSVSSILITSPGDYSVAPTGISFTGGGAASAASVIWNSGWIGVNTGGGLTFQGSGTTTLSAANTYAGGTTVNGGTLLVNNSSGSGTGSGAVNVSGSGTVLGGSGTISGATVISNSAALTPQPSGGGSTTLSFSGNLALKNASANFTLSSTASGGNDRVLGVAQLTVDSTVTFNITAPGGLDTSGDYQLISSTSLNNGAGGTPTLVVNGVTSDQTSLGSYKLLVTAFGVALHYISATAPAVDSATFSPNPQYHNGGSTLTVLVTPTSGNTISSISVTTDELGGAGDSTSLTRTDANGPGLQETWVGTFNVPSGQAAGNYTVGGTVTQSDSYTATYSTLLSVALNTYVWNGNATPGDNNWTTGNNWVGGAAPGAGDSVDFSGNNGLNPNMDQDFNLASLVFDNLATATFTIGGSSTLNLSAVTPIINNSSNEQVLNMPVSMSSAATFNAASGNLTLGGSVNNGGVLTVTGAKDTTVSGGVIGIGGLTKTGKGTLTLSGANNYAGATTISAGNVVVSDSGSINNLSGMTVGCEAGDADMLMIGGSVTVSTMAIGGGGNATDTGGGTGAGAGAVYQTNGTVTMLLNSSGPPSDSIFILGGTGNQGTAGYGYYKLSGGTLSGTTINIGGRVNQGLGVMDVLAGGTVQAAGSLPIGRGNGTAQPGYGLLNVAGGAVNITGTVNPNPGGDSQLMMGYRGGISELDISGGGRVALPSTNAVAYGWGMDMMRLAEGSTSVVNLNAGGTLSTPVIFATASGGGGFSLLNFNGGTLQAASVNTAGNFLSSPNMGAVTIYSGGATVDNNGTAITISNALLGASGDGVQTIVVSSGGSNYIGAPLVQITGGTANNGSVATAVANMVDDGSGKTFKVGSITITSPGSYSADPTGVSIVGNGGATLAVANIGTIAVNTSGGLTSIGGGTLTLAGANTYTGVTAVAAGTLEMVNPVLSSKSTVSVAAGAVLQLDFATTNQVTDLVLDGVHQPAGVYNSTTSSPFIAGAGSLYVGVPVATNPTNIMVNASGGNLVLSWPADHIGWHLQVQTNSLAGGLGTNWVDVPNTSAVDSFTNSMNPANGAVFYRLTYP